MQWWKTLYVITNPMKYLGPQVILIFKYVLPIIKMDVLVIFYV